MKKLLELPNQKKIYFLNEQEALFLYDDIFVRQSYLQHGITLKAGDVVFDIGANIGLFALFAHQYCQGNVNLFCFEPIDLLYRTYLGSFFAVQAIANLLSISLTKQRLILVVAFSRVPINFFD